MRLLASIVIWAVPASSWMIVQTAEEFDQQQCTEPITWNYLVPMATLGFIGMVTTATLMYVIRTSKDLMRNRPIWLLGLDSVPDFVFCFCECRSSPDHHHNCILSYHWVLAFNTDHAVM